MHFPSCHSGFKYSSWGPFSSVQFSSVHLFSHVDSLRPQGLWPGFPAHHQLLELAQTHSIELVMPSNYLILCHPLLLLFSIFPSNRIFSSESVLRIRWPKYWSFSFSISSSNIQDWFPLGWTGWISLQSKGLQRVFSNTTVQKHQLFSAKLSV